MNGMDYKGKEDIIGGIWRVEDLLDPKYQRVVKLPRVKVFSEPSTEFYDILLRLGVFCQSA